MKRSWMGQTFCLLFVLIWLVLLPVGVGHAAKVLDVLTPPEPGIADGWQVFHADAPLSFADLSQHSLRLDASGNPRLVYGGDHLYYAYRDSTWHIETVDGTWGVGKGAVLALDANGKAHIAYYDSVNQDLKYATNKSGAWHVETVASSGDVGAYSDIAIDFWGDPALVYYDATLHQLRYTYYDSEYGGWGPDVVVTGNVYSPHHPGWFSFALDTSVIPNKPHLSFYKSTNENNASGALYYTTYANGWVTPEVKDYCTSPDICHAGEYNSLALHPVSKLPSIAYSYDGPPSSMLIYRAFDGTNWSSEYVNFNLPAFVTLAIDANSNAYVTYQNSEGFFYELRSAGAWASSKAIALTAGAGQWSSMALIGATPKVVHYYSQSGLLSYAAYNSNGTWLSEVVATQGHQVGACTSLAVDSLGRSHISYFDSPSQAVLYGRFDGNLPLIKDTIDSSGTAVCNSVIAVNPLTNDPVVGLVKGSDLYYAVYSSGTWQAAGLVDSGITVAGDGNQKFGLAVRSDGMPVLAYLKGGALMLAYKTGAAWSKVTAANGASGKLSLALDSSSRPHILFYQSSVMKHTFNPGTDWSTGWVTESPMGTASSFNSAALAAGPSGQISAAFLGGGGMELHYISRTNNCNIFTQVCLWTSDVTVDAQCEEQFSLALDKHGTPHATCMAYTNPGYDLHYMTRPASTWEIQAVDTYGTVGWYPDLALSQSGNPRISYQDLTNTDLKFALVPTGGNLYIPMLMK